ncbi:MAG: CDP-alcohol phosphatidyltransferase family protein [Planctomycetota bacterium]
MNAANTITVFRLVAIPPFVFSAWQGTTPGSPPWTGGLAFGLFVAAGVSDMIDGWVARHFGQVTPLGRVLDPLADKLLSLACLLLLARPIDGGLFTRLPVWFGAVVIARDVWLGGGSWLIWKWRGPFRVEPHASGKITTLLLFLLYSLCLLGLPRPPVRILMVLATIGIVVSGFLYTQDGLRHWARPVEPPS